MQVLLSQNNQGGGPSGDALRSGLGSFPRPNPRGLAPIRGHAAIAFVGLPGAGKSLLSLCLREAGFSVYRWSDLMKVALVDLYRREATPDEIRANIWLYIDRYTKEFEATDPAHLARQFLLNANVRADSARLMIIDGPKKIEQLEHLCKELERAPLIVRVEAKKTDRAQHIEQRRNAYDAASEAKREKHLKNIGLIQFMKRADLVIDLTGSPLAVDKDQKVLHVRLLPAFVDSVHEFFRVLGLSNNTATTEELVLKGCKAFAAENQLKMKLAGAKLT